MNQKSVRSPKHMVIPLSWWRSHIMPPITPQPVTEIARPKPRHSRWRHGVPSGPWGQRGVVQTPRSKPLTRHAKMVWEIARTDKHTTCRSSEGIWGMGGEWASGRWVSMSGIARGHVYAEAYNVCTGTRQFRSYC